MLVYILDIFAIMDHMNTLVNKKTIEKLEGQMTFASMVNDNVSERVYSSFDGRIVATLDHDNASVKLTAISWDRVVVCTSIKEAAKLLIKDSIEQKKNWTENKKNKDLEHA